MRVRILWTAALAVTLCGLALAPTAFASTSYRGAASRSHAYPAMAHASAGHAQHATGKQFHPTDVLYSQYDNAGVNASSRRTSRLVRCLRRRARRRLRRSRVATAGTSIRSTSQVLYYNGGGPAASLTSASTQTRAALPGSMRRRADGASYVLRRRRLHRSASTPAGQLGEGTYWVSVQAHMDFSSGGQFGWTDRTVTYGQRRCLGEPGRRLRRRCLDAGTRKVTTCITDPRTPTRSSA